MPSHWRTCFLLSYLALTITPGSSQSSQSLVVEPPLVHFKISFLQLIPGTLLGGRDKNVSMDAPTNLLRRWQLRIYSLTVEGLPNYEDAMAGSDKNYLYPTSLSPSADVYVALGQAVYAVQIIDPDDSNTDPSQFGYGRPLYNGRVNVTGVRTVVKAPPAMEHHYVVVQMATIACLVRFKSVASLPGVTTPVYADGVSFNIFSVNPGARLRWTTGITTSGGYIFAFSPGSQYMMTITLPSTPTITTLSAPLALSPPNGANAWSLSAMTEVFVNAQQTLLCASQPVFLRQLAGCFPTTQTLANTVYVAGLECTWVIITGKPLVKLSVNYTMLQPGDAIIIITDNTYEVKLPPTGALKTVASSTMFEATFQAYNLTIVFVAGPVPGSNSGFMFKWQGMESHNRFSSQYILIIAVCSAVIGALLLCAVLWYWCVRPAIRRSRAAAAARQASVMDSVLGGAAGGARVKHHVSKRILRLLPVRTYEKPAGSSTTLDFTTHTFKTDSSDAAAATYVTSCTAAAGATAPPLIPYVGAAAMPSSDAGTSLCECCAICLLDYVTGERVRLLPCQHFFHIACIDQWLRRDVVCPLCKANVLDAVEANNNPPRAQVECDLSDDDPAAEASGQHDVILVGAPGVGGPLIGAGPSVSTSDSCTGSSGCSGIGSGSTDGVSSATGDARCLDAMDHQEGGESLTHGSPPWSTSSRQWSQLATSSAAAAPPRVGALSSVSFFDQMPAAGSGPSCSSSIAPPVSRGSSGNLLRRVSDLVTGETGSSLVTPARCSDMGVPPTAAVQAPTSATLPIEQPQLMGPYAAGRDAAVAVTASSKPSLLAGGQLSALPGSAPASRGDLEMAEMSAPMEAIAGRHVTNSPGGHKPTTM